VKTVKHSLFCP